MAIQGTCLVPARLDLRLLAASLRRHCSQGVWSDAQRLFKGGMVMDTVGRGQARERGTAGGG